MRGAYHSVRCLALSLKRQPQIRLRLILNSERDRPPVALFHPNSEVGVLAARFALHRARGVDHLGARRNQPPFLKILGRLWIDGFVKPQTIQRPA
jgi:hypothetical protein